jgi:PleD family two-component response regulator
MQFNTRVIPIDLTPKQPTVLLIDDDKDRARRTERVTLLKRQGLKVVPARRLDLAMKRSKSGAFDMIVVHAENNMPAAIEFCNEIRGGSRSQKMLIIGDGTMEHELAIADDMNLLHERVQAALKPAQQERQPEQEMAAA